MNKDREHRAFKWNAAMRQSEDGSNRNLEGHAAVFNDIAVIAGLFRERFAPGAFAASLDANDDVVALFNHNPEIVLGRRASGTLRLKEDERGLLSSIDLPDTQSARDLHELVRRGDIYQMSIGFFVGADTWEAVGRDELPLRTILSAQLVDVSPVTFPAYAGTDVSARATERARACVGLLRRKTAQRLRDLRLKSLYNL